MATAVHVSAVSVPAASSLEDIQTACASSEAILGPLMAIGNNRTDTVLTFDTGKRPPDDETVIQQTVGGTPIAPPGLTLVCSGHAFVTGQLTMLAGFAKPR
jgi:hypothetical protein